MSTSYSTTQGPSGNFIRRTLNPLEDIDEDEEERDLKRNVKADLTEYLVDLGYQENRAEQQAKEIVTDTVIGDIEEARQKIDALEALSNEFALPTAEDVKNTAIEFYEVQKNFERSSNVYKNIREELHQTTEEYFESNISIPNPETQANRIVTEAALGNAHIYETLEKIDAIKAMKNAYGVEN